MTACQVRLSNLFILYKTECYCINPTMRVLLVSSNTEKLNMPTAPLGLACVAETVKKTGHLVDMMFQADFAKVFENCRAAPAKYRRN